MRRSDLILSFLYPVVVEKTGSRWNPHLEVVITGGKYAMNSANANYSYGSLYSLFKKIFRRTQIDWNKINEVLVLGFGAGGVAEIINKYKGDCRIDGVEIDEQVLALARKYFKTDLLKNVTLFCTSAEEFISGCKKKYDLVVIDVYNDLNVPESIESEEFLSGVYGVSAPGGIVIFNKFIHDRKSQDESEKLKEKFGNLFGEIDTQTVMLTAKVLVARKKVSEG